MVKFFEIQVRIGRITLEQVPEEYRSAVQEMLGNKGGAA